MTDIKDLLAQCPRNPDRIAEYRNRYPKCVSRLTDDEKVVVERIFTRWYHRAAWHRVDAD